MEEGIANSLQDSTKLKNATAVKLWEQFTKDIGAPTIMYQNPNLMYGSLRGHELNTRLTLMMAFGSALQKGLGKNMQGHKTIESSVAYCIIVNGWHNDVAGNPIIPPAKIHWDEIKKVIKGLHKMRSDPTYVRKGLNMEQVMELNYLTTRLKNQEFTYKGVTRRWTSAMIQNVRSLRTFAWQQLYRMGEATVTDMKEWRKPLKQGERLSRTSFKYRKVSYDPVNPHHEAYIAPATRYKCNNMYTDADISVPIRPKSIEEGLLCAGSELKALIKVDGCSSHATHIIGTTERRRELCPPPETIPMWRFPPDHDDDLTNLSLTAEFIMMIDRQLIRNNPHAFESIKAEDIGGHSYRIGGCSALLEAGASPLIIQAMGRWSSTCYLLYCRQGLSQKEEWSYRMLKGKESRSSPQKEFWKSPTHKTGRAMTEDVKRGLNQMMTDRAKARRPQWS